MASVLDRIERIASRRPGFAQIGVRDSPCRAATARRPPLWRRNPLSRPEGNRWIYRRSLVYWDSNVSGTVALVECMLEVGTETIVFL